MGTKRIKQHKEKKQGGEQKNVNKERNKVGTK